MTWRIINHAVEDFRALGGLAIRTAGHFGPADPAWRPPSAAGAGGALGYSNAAIVVESMDSDTISSGW